MEIKPTISIEFLRQFESSEEFKKLLENPTFKSVKVDYETPNVNRLWAQLTPTIRFFLHEILPCATSLYHPHPWASTMRILPVGGLYEMLLGSKEEILSRTQFDKGGYYEMLNPLSWHSVIPLTKPVYSVMLTEKVEGWDIWSPKADYTLQELAQNTYDNILNVFKNFYL